jgi:hypothetical protein
MTVSRTLLVPLVLGTSMSLAATDDTTTCMAGEPNPAIIACSRIISAGALSTSELLWSTVIEESNSNKKKNMTEHSPITIRQFN